MVVVDYLRAFGQKQVPAAIGAYTLVMVLLSLALGLTGGSPAGAESPPPSVVAQTAADEGVPDHGFTNEEVRLIARVVEGEAANEPYRGKVAVGAVVLNRVKHDKYPDSVRGVIYQPLAFCVVANGLINRTPTGDSLQAARAAASGEDPTGGALYFWNPRKNPNPWVWGRTPLITIGNHVFAR